MNKGFTLVELLVVLAMSTFLIGMALVGTQGTQAQVTLNTAAASFISNINFVKNNAIAGSVSLGSDIVSHPPGSPPGSLPNWVYGFAIFPGELSSTPSSNPELCLSTGSSECSAGYYTAIIEKNKVGSSCSDSTSNSSPPVGNSLNNVNNLNTCAYPPDLILHGLSPGHIFSLTHSHAHRSGVGVNWVYYNAFPIGVSISYPLSSHEYFPVFQELTGYLYLYDLNTGNIVTNPSSTSSSVIFNLSYEGYTIPITFYDLYYHNASSGQSNTFSEGNITNNG